jgi:hypothetical protein
MRNIRTMKLIGFDSWDRPVYKCIENGILWKDITCGSEKPELCSCNNTFDGEPDCMIKSDIEVIYTNQFKKNPNNFNYQMLDRLKSECDYYLGNGGRYEKHLWAGNVVGQIDKMKELYNSFKEDEKPEWLTYEQILSYEKSMM